MRIVVSQSMYFPWVGLLEQVRLADTFVHYDDVQFARGFYNRVQIKTEQGSRWMTVPLKGYHRGQKIDEILLDDSVDWRQQHRELLRQAYLQAPFREEMLSLVDDAFSVPVTTLSDISRASILALADYFNLSENTRYLNSKDLAVAGKSSQRLRDIVVKCGGNVYLTGHGAKNYMDHMIFEESGIEVRYMDYRCSPYPQLHGEFTPYVTALDLVANCGRDGAKIIQSESLYWRDFINETD